MTSPAAPRASRLWAGVAALLPAVALALAPLPTARPEDQGMSSQRLARIGEAMAKDIAEGSFRGAVVMVARKGKLVYHEAFGMQSAKAKMGEDAIFRIYSMTKPLAAVAAMMLVEDGKLQLDDPVARFLPGWDKLKVSVAARDPAGKPVYVTVPAERAMTVRDLLRHTSGLAYGEITANPAVREALEKAGVYRKDIEFEARGMTPAEQVARMSAVPLAYQPGTTWHYSLATDALGRVVEAASGQRLGDFLDARLFKPLKMSDTAFRVPPAKLPRLAEPPEKDGHGNRAPPLIDVSSVPKNDSGGAGGVSTAGDYLRFCQMLLNGGTLDGTRVLSRATVRLMTSDQLGGFIATPVQPGELLLGAKGYTFGLGFAVRQGNGVASTDGAAGEFTWAGYAGTYFFVDPKEQLVAVLMTQAASPDPVYLRNQIRNLVYQAIND